MMPEQEYFEIQEVIQKLKDVFGSGFIEELLYDNDLYTKSKGKLIKSKIKFRTGWTEIQLRDFLQKARFLIKDDDCENV